MISKMLARILLFAVFVFIPTTLLAQNVPAMGSSIKGQQLASICVSKKLTFTDGSTACMEQFEPLVIGENDRNLAEQAQSARTHSFAIRSSDSPCLVSTGWAWNGTNDDQRAVDFCEAAAKRKSSKLECRCTTLIPVSGSVEMTQRNFVRALFKIAYELIEHRRATNVPTGLSLDVLKEGLETRERMHYERIAKE